MPGRIAAMEALPPHRPLKALEVGVGSGLSLPHYPNGIDLIAIDPMNTMLSEAANQVRNSLAKVTLLQMNGEQLSFPDNTFDAAIMLYVLPAVPDARSLLREVHRVIRPGGSAIVVNAFHQRNRFLKLLSRAIPKKNMAQLIGFHAELRPEDITEAPGWTLAQQRKIEKSHLFVLEKTGETSVNGAASGI